MHQIKLSMIDIFVEKDGDKNSPGEINFVLFVAGQELAHSNWAWPLSDGSRRTYGLDVFLNTELTEIPIRFDVHEEDTWPEKNDFARSDLNINLLDNWGRNAWQMRAVSSNQNLICSLSFILEVVSQTPTPTTITAYEHIDARGKSINLMDTKVAKVVSPFPEIVDLYQFDCTAVQAGGALNDQISSLYVPTGDYEITLFEHTPQDPRFAEGGRLDIPYKAPYLLNLPDLKYQNTRANCNDSVSYIEIKHRTHKRPILVDGKLEPKKPIK